MTDELAETPMPYCVCDEKDDDACNTEPVCSRWNAQRDMDSQKEWCWDCYHEHGCHEARKAAEAGR